MTTVVLVDDDYEYDDDYDGGYMGYIPTAVSLGPGLLVVALLATFLAYGVLLPCLVVRGGRRRETQQRQQQQKGTRTSTWKETTPVTNQPQGEAEEAKAEENDEEGNALVSVDVTPKRRARRSKHSKIDSKKSNNNIIRNEASRKSCCSDDDDEISCAEDKSTRTVSQKSSSASSSSSSKHSCNSEWSSVVVAIMSHPRLPKNKKQRKRRRLKEQQVMAATRRTAPDVQHHHHHHHRRNNRLRTDPTITATSGEATNTPDPDLVKLLQAIHPGSIPVKPVASESHHGSELDDDFLIETVSRPEFSVTLLPPQQQQQIVVAQQEELPPLVVNDDNLTGYPHLERPGDFAKLGVLDKVTTIAAWDMELKRIIKLSMPYCTQALITGVTDTLNVAVIGKLIGTREGTVCWRPMVWSLSYGGDLDGYCCAYTLFFSCLLCYSFCVCYS